MKKVLFTLLCVLGLASCAQAQKQNEVKNSKALVTYFSATGTSGGKDGESRQRHHWRREELPCCISRTELAKGRLLNSPSDKEIKVFMK